MSPNVVNAKFLKTLETPMFMRVPEPPISLGVRGIGSSNLPVPACEAGGEIESVFPGLRSDADIGSQRSS